MKPSASIKLFFFLQGTAQNAAVVTTRKFILNKTNILVVHETSPIHKL